ncbi:hypothetical protein C0989_012610 [Termitomyces sp. Mn162]|nr:hypothetical protein C0989_012610 [Termitomyces sp. Mn162]
MVDWSLKIHMLCSTQALLRISMSPATGLLTPTRRSMPPPSAREYLQAAPPTFPPPTTTRTQPLQST